MQERLKSLHINKFIGKIGYAISAYRIVLTAAILCIVFGLALLRIDSLSNPTINEEKLAEQQATIKRVNFDNEAITQIQNLVDSGIDINSNFDPGRDNPFEFTDE